MPGRTPRYSEEFKADAVALVRSSGKTVTQVARDLGVSPEGLRGWYKQDQAERGVPARVGGESALSAAEREELRELRRRGKAQDETISILKSNCLLRERPPVEEFYRFVHVQKADHHVPVLCRDQQCAGVLSYLLGHTAQSCRPGGHEHCSGCDENRCNERADDSGNHPDHTAGCLNGAEAGATGCGETYSSTGQPCQKRRPRADRATE
jgi:transposase-like protein